MPPFVVPVSSFKRNKWCLVFGIINRDKFYPPVLPFMGALHFKDSNQLENSYYLKPIRFSFYLLALGIIYIPRQCNAITLNSIDPNRNKRGIFKKVWLLPLSRIVAAFLLAIIHPFFTFKTLLKFKYKPVEYRQLIRLIATSEPQNLTYKTWCEIYDRPIEKNNASTHAMNLDIHIYSSSDGSIYSNNITLETTNDLTQHYVGILQDFEIISNSALDLFFHFAEIKNSPAALYGDIDYIDTCQHRSRPYFKPNLEYAMLCSGLLTLGLWLIRKDIFEEFQHQNQKKFTCAFSHRLALAFYILHKKGKIAHIPHVLTHISQALNQTIIQKIHETVTSELNSRRWHYEISHKTSFPILVNPIFDQQRVTFIIPTTLNNRYVTKCIHSVIKNTSYPHCEFLLILSQNCQLSDEQTRNLTHLLAHENVNYLQIFSDAFNFSHSCNSGIKLAQTDFVVILNDDVTPINNEWLHYMMGHMQDNRVGAVGAKLYYKQGFIQHNGIIMGAGNLCEHKDRFKQDDELSFKGDFDCSAVTGACMLLRKGAIDRFNGFDENLAIAYNDVDLCLKLRKFGYRVVQCQRAHLIHYESFSLKNHYTSDRKGKERDEIFYMRHRWSEALRSDPFYNPNLSLQLGRLDQLAFPPRRYCPTPSTPDNFFCT
ncbi:hypothetical protein COMNV_01118 [Commensalibacter sp. Nvir]|uniref:glycosyltransferase n=1 Tax=Commensalibacter sp. Nvir TaxID=3069817 RepID=UPI002D4B053A|nr:hypothetical protein COMNV_01118 [Commensalibacter sp. Nvir]